MYIATIPNRNSPPAILLRHAYRENGKVKNRTLANLSHWQSARIEALRRALRGEFDHASLSAEPTLGPIFGLLYVLKQIAEALGITAALSNTTLGKLALFLVLARLPHQGSRLSALGRTLGRGSRRQRSAGTYLVRRRRSLRGTRRFVYTARKDRAGPVPPLPEPPWCTTAALVSLRRYQQLSGRREERTRRVRLRSRWQARQAANRHRPADRPRR